jgi:hypothetical protein
MKKVFILFIDNSGHSDGSKQILCVGSTMDFVQVKAEIHAKNNGVKLQKNDILGLEFDNQTQGREENYMIEEHTIDSFFL